MTPTELAYDQTLVPEAMEVLPLSVGFAVEYLDGVMLHERVEIRNQWISVRAHIITEALRASAVRAGTTADDKPHKIMTREEYISTSIIGWHRVCRNVDGMKNVGIQYEGERSRAGAMPSEEEVDRIAHVIASDLGDHQVTADVVKRRGLAARLARLRGSSPEGRASACPSMEKISEEIHTACLDNGEEISKIMSRFAAQRVLALVGGLPMPGIRSSPVSDGAPSDVLDALRAAEEGLSSCYQVCDYPANGRSQQDYALAQVRGVIQRLTSGQ